MSIEKVKSGGQSHRMSLLIDVEMGRPIEAEVSVAFPSTQGNLSIFVVRSDDD